jgi:hypothetical protein
LAEGDQNGASLATESSDTGAAPDTGNQTKATSGSQDLVLKLSDFDEKTRDRLAKFKTGNDVVKSYLALESKMGASITIPGKDASDEERSAFYKRLGRPETKDGYVLDPVFLADKVTKDSEFEENVKALAFDLNASNDGAKKLHKALIEYANRGAEKLEEMKEQSRQTLRTKDWVGTYDKNIGLVQSVIKKFGDTEMVQYLNSGPGNDPPMLKFLAKVAKAFSPDSFEIGGRPSEGGEDDGSNLFPNSPQMTGPNRFRGVNRGTR